MKITIVSIVAFCATLTYGAIANQDVHRLLEGAIELEGNATQVIAAFKNVSKSHLLTVLGAEVTQLESSIHRVKSLLTQNATVKQVHQLKVETEILQIAQGQVKEQLEFVREVFAVSGQSKEELINYGEALILKVKETVDKHPAGHKHNELALIQEEVSKMETQMNILREFTSGMRHEDAEKSLARHAFILRSLLAKLTHAHV